MCSILGRTFGLALITCTTLTGAALADDKEDIEAAVTKFENALNAGDAAAASAMYTEDAVLLPPNSPMVRGRGEIETFWKSMGSAGVSDLDLTPTEIMVSGSNASEVGTVSFSMDGRKGTGKYIVLWAKGDDGTWRLHRDIWNEDQMAH